MTRTGWHRRLVRQGQHACRRKDRLAPAARWPTPGPRSIAPRRTRLPAARRQAAQNRVTVAAHRGTSRGHASGRTGSRNWALSPWLRQLASHSRTKYLSVLVPAVAGAQGGLHRDHSRNHDPTPGSPLPSATPPCSRPDEAGGQLSAVVTAANCIPRRQWNSRGRARAPPSPPAPRLRRRWH